jgi:hypothetical protein
MARPKDLGLAHTWRVMIMKILYQSQSPDLRSFADFRSSRRPRN